MTIAYRGQMSTAQLAMLNNSLYLGNTFGLAERMNAIQVTSTGAQELHADDNETLKFGSGTDQTADTTDYDVQMLFDTTNLQMLPRTDDLAAFNIGNGTLDMDFKVFMGSTTKYVLFDNSGAIVNFEDTRLDLNTSSSTVGNGYPLDATNMRVLGAYGDDANAAIGSGTMMKAIEGRVLLAYTAGNREQEAVGVLGKLVSKQGVNRHNMCGVMGSYEVNTSLTVDGQAYTIDPWIQAAIIGRIGAGSGITTLNANAILAGVAAMSNTTSLAADSGAYVGFYVGRWGSLLAWDYGLIMETGAIKNGMRIGNSTTGVTLTTYANHAIEVYTTCASVDASNSVEPIYMKSVMTGAGGVGGRAKFYTLASAALGGWCNAVKGLMQFADSTGRVTGLGSAICGELVLSTGTIQGTYTAFEAELIADSVVSTGTLTSFMRFNIAGTNSTGKTTINTNGYLFDLGEGIVDTASGLIDAASITATNFTHRIRIRALGVDMWIGAHTDPDFTT